MALVLILTREAFSGQRVNFWLETGDDCKSLVGKGPKFWLSGCPAPDFFSVWHFCNLFLRCFLLLYTLRPHRVSLSLFLTHIKAEQIILPDIQVVNVILCGQKHVDTLALHHMWLLNIFFSLYSFFFLTRCLSLAAGICSHCATSVLVRSGTDAG